MYYKWDFWIFIFYIFKCNEASLPKSFIRSGCTCGNLSWLAILFFFISNIFRSFLKYIYDILSKYITTIKRAVIYDKKKFEKWQYYCTDRRRLTSVVGKQIGPRRTWHVSVYRRQDACLFLDQTILLGLYMVI